MEVGGGGGEGGGMAWHTAVHSVASGSRHVHPTRPLCATSHWEFVAGRTLLTRACWCGVSAALHLAQPFYRMSSLGHPLHV